MVFLWFFVRIYKIKALMPGNVKQLKPPFLLLSNHVGFWDPFITGYFLPGFTHFVASDAVLRSPLMRIVLNALGVIPKKKNMRDTRVIRQIIAEKNKGNSIGIFPEAVRNWIGESFPIDFSIVKLIRLLQIPVVVSVMKGMNLFNPRWSPTLRKSGVVIQYNLLFTPEDIAGLSDTEMHEKLTQALYHNDTEYQKQHMQPILSEKRAEYINTALYVCPHCKGIDTIRVAKNNLWCFSCQYKLFIDTHGFFNLLKGTQLYFDNSNSWYYWQESYLWKHVQNLLILKSSEAIFTDTGLKVYAATGNNHLKYIGTANASLYPDKIEITFEQTQKTLIMDFYLLQTINPQVHERLEIYYNHTAYRLVSIRKGMSALKWEVAVNAIWSYYGEKHKCSSYIYYKR